MKVYVCDIFGEKVYENVTKVEWIKKDWWNSYEFRKVDESELEIRMLIHFGDGRKPIHRHIDDIVKIEGE
jgi:hypothetical protein